MGSYIKRSRWRCSTGGKLMKDTPFSASCNNKQTNMRKVITPVHINISYINWSFKCKKHSNIEATKQALARYGHSSSQTVFGKECIFLQYDWKSCTHYLWFFKIAFFTSPIFCENWLQTTVRFFPLGQVGAHKLGVHFEFDIFLKVSFWHLRFTTTFIPLEIKTD